MNIKEQIIHYSEALPLCKLLIAEGGQVRFVGGCVRDVILNKKFSDIDIATNLTPDEVEKILKKHHVECFSIGKAFGTITAVISKQKFEITTLRKDLNCDGRYAQVKFTNNWQEDAQRRDFTINALSCDLEGNIYDYFDGIDDLKKGIIRFIGDPEKRILEDHLRILRFFRFSAYYSKNKLLIEADKNLNIDSKGLIAVQKHAHHLKHVSGTRIRSELSKIFTAPYAVEILKLMEEKEILPFIIYSNKTTISYLDNLYKIVQNFNHKINEILCFGLLLRFSSQVDKILNNFAFTRSESSLLRILIEKNITDWSESGLKNAWQLYKHNFKEVILVNMAIVTILPSSFLKMDIKPEIGDLVSIELLHRLFNTPLQESPIKAKDLELLNIEPSKQMGDLLTHAEQIWYNHEFKISKKEILKELAPYVNQL